MDIDNDSASEYVRSLYRAQNRCLAAMDATVSNIEATKQMEIMCSEKNFDALSVIKGLLLEVEELKKSDNCDYMTRLKQENSMLRSMNNLSPLSAQAPPLPKPTQVFFMSADTDIVRLETSKKSKEKTLEAIGALMQDTVLSTSAVRALAKAQKIMQASRMEDQRLLDNFWSYRQRRHRESEEPENAHNEKRKREEEEVWDFQHPDLKRQNASGTDYDEDDDEEDEDA
tara:strand:+ start:1113 stop:1796 length:684 start_codon:yes stop_codon:yes gene_type:complete